MPLVSAVIPTTGRPTLPAAIRSVRQQGDDTEVVVVVDAPQDRSLLELASGADVVVFTGGRGGGAARNAGVAAATGAWIGFLDDDDEWLPGKTRTQLDAADATGADVVSSRVRQSFLSGDLVECSGPVPRSVYDSGSVAEYLFRRRRAGNGRASLYTSSLLVRRSVARSVPWAESLRRHQDWDWLVRAVDDASAVLVQVPDVCVEIRTGTADSISRSADWRTSLGWAAGVLRSRDRAVYADFVTAQPLRYALSARSVSGVAACLVALIRAGRLPSTSTAAVALAGCLPQSTFAALYRAVR